MERALQSKSIATWLSPGLAMFSMFFGAGNVIFPLIVGKTAEGGVFFALLGLGITAILIPFSGLIATLLYEGDYERFFGRFGRIPRAFLIWSILALIGPFGGIPRCIGLTYSTLNVYVPNLPLLAFSIISLVLLFFSVIQKRKILSLLGNVLTPILLIFLVFIVGKALFSHGLNIHGGAFNGMEAFIYGLREGYNTMDLLAAFFFASVVMTRLKGEEKGRVGDLFKASLVGGVLLALVYTGFAVAAAGFNRELAGSPSDQLLGKLGQVVLGDSAGVVVCMVVLLSCLTTAIALVAVTSDYLHITVFKGRVSYYIPVLIVLVITFFVSMLQFSGIVKLLAPVLQVSYPLLLILSLWNLSKSIKKA